MATGLRVELGALEEAALVVTDLGSALHGFIVVGRDPDRRAGKPGRSGPERRVVDLDVVAGVADRVAS